MKIEGNRILIRQLEEGDLEHFFEYRSDPQVCRYQNFMVHSREEVKSFIEEQKTRELGFVGDWIQIAVEHKQDERLIGDCAILFKKEEPRMVEVGYTIAPEYQRKGFATEALRLLMKTIFKSHNVHKVLAFVDVRNPSSTRVLEKIGFKQEGRFRQHFFDKQTNSWVDEIQYAYLQEDFMEEIF